MNKTLLIIFLFAALPTTISAQLINKKPENRFNLSYATQYYFNKSYIVNDGILPNPISTRNTLGYNMELAYQRVTSWGLVVQAGFKYGYQQHNVIVDFDVSNFDNEATRSLTGKHYHHEYDWQFQYISPRFMLGYVHPLPQNKFKGWVAEIKAGIAINVFSYGSGYGEVINIRYAMDQPNQYKQATIARTYITMGNTISADGPNKWNINPTKNAAYDTWEGYLGIRKETSNKFLKNLAIGIEYTISMYKGTNNNNLTVLSFDKQQNVISTDYYLNYYKSIGLRIGVGLW